ncbi:MAG: chitobiase/beta-hexosaminidase C-terminal domain-containing protein [Paludibacteraceae bacterium]|nr:chitobiase/beta-hexosaminidase C-terminal domain-containing protein [Paludibacteraceae bacterium]
MKKITFFLSALLISVMSFAAESWSIVTDASTLAAGDQVVIVAAESNVALSTTQNSNNRGQATITKSENTVTINADVQVMTLEAGTIAGTLAFNVGGGYLCAASTSKNYLRTETVLSANSSWKITITDGIASVVAQGDMTRNVMQYNSSSSIFACYSSASQKAVQLYKKVISDEPADVIVKTLKSIAVEGMTTDYETGDIFKFDGTCTATYGVTKNDVPQEDETKEVTPTSVSTPDMTTAGEKEVTVTYTEDEVTVTATYTINVTENVITAGTYDIVPNNAFWGTSFTGTNANTTETLYGKQDDISILHTRSGSNLYVNDSQTRVYVNHYMQISVPAGYVITAIAFTADGNNWEGTHTADVGTMTAKNWTGSANAVTITFGGTCRITKITVTYAEVGETPEVPTIAAPTFSLAEDTYTEAQEVTLSAEEGTIYYTLDGTTPDAESIEYTAPIVLDECGEITIKAIAISGEITSSVASATYTIKLPLNNSQANPYTEADAIEVYDGGCYDNQDVYVKGVVANAQFYSSNTYTITLEGGFQFYKFYEAAGEVTFTENYIVAGDTLVACGKLDNYKGTYQLAAGCYLVERKPYSAPKVDISNTPETAYTVAEAMALIDNITSDLTKQVYVKGEISEVESFNDYYGSITYWIVDEVENKFQCYSGKGLNNEPFTSVEDLVVGSQVVVYGTLKKHNSTYEFDYNNYIVSLTLPSYTVTVTAENGTVEGAGKYEHGATATLTATAASGYKFVNWTEGEEIVAETAEYTFIVTADRNLVANFKVAGPTTGVDNVEATVAAKKAIINGQLIIVKDGVKFNALGQVIK